MPYHDDNNHNEDEDEPYGPDHLGTWENSKMYLHDRLASDRADIRMLQRSLRRFQTVVQSVSLEVSTLKVKMAFIGTIAGALAAVVMRKLFGV